MGPCHEAGGGDGLTHRTPLDDGGGTAPARLEAIRLSWTPSRRGVAGGRERRPFHARPSEQMCSRIARCPSAVAMRRNVLRLAPLAFALLLPAAAADFSIPGGAVVIHADGDPGATAAPAQTSACGYERGPPDAGFQCPTGYDAAAGTPWRIDAAGARRRWARTRADARAPSRASIWATTSSSTSSPSTARTTRRSASSPRAATSAGPSPPPSSPLPTRRSLAAAPQRPAPGKGLPHRLRRAAGLGLPVCVERASDGFDVVCETSPSTLP